MVLRPQNPARDFVVVPGTGEVDDFYGNQRRVEGDAGDARGVVRLGPGDPGDVRAVAVVVDRSQAERRIEVSAVMRPPRDTDAGVVVMNAIGTVGDVDLSVEVGMGGVDPGVPDCDLHACRSRIGVRIDRPALERVDCVQPPGATKGIIGCGKVDLESARGLRVDNVGPLVVDGSFGGSRLARLESDDVNTSADSP